MRLLDTAAAAGVLDAASAETLQHLYLAYRSTLHRRALNLLGSVLDGDNFVQERQQVQAIWHRLFPHEAGHGSATT